MTDQQLPDRTGDVIDDIAIALTQRGDLSDEHRAFYQSLLDRFDVLAADRDRALRAAREATTEHDGTRRVYSAHDIDVIERAAMASGAASMRERAADAIQPRWDLQPEAQAEARQAIRALPLLPDNTDTLPAEDLVEPGDEVPALAELADRVAALEELTAAQADLLEKYGRDLEGATRPASAPGQHAARYRDRAGDLWEERPDGLLETIAVNPERPGDLGITLPRVVAERQYGPLTPHPASGPSGPCDTCGRAPDEQETGPDGRCRHTPATRLGHPTTKTGDTK